MTRPRWTREPAAMRRALVRPVHVIAVPRKVLDNDPYADGRQIDAYRRHLAHFSLARGTVDLRVHGSIDDTVRIVVDASAMFPLRRRKAGQAEFPAGWTFQPHPPPSKPERRTLGLRVYRPRTRPTL